MGDEKTDAKTDYLTQFKEAFAKELAGITDIVELKELYATEIARRDVLIKELREQNELLLKSMMKSKADELAYSLRRADKQHTHQ